MKKRALVLSISVLEAQVFPATSSFGDWGLWCCRDQHPSMSVARMAYHKLGAHQGSLFEL